MRSIRLVAALAAGLAACGDDGGNTTPDADPIEQDGPAPDSPPNPSGCDYTEADDAGNDDVTQGGTPELTGHSLTSTFTICGNVDTGNHDPQDGTLDVDGYAVNLPAGRVMITLSGVGLETLEQAAIGVYSGSGFETIEAEEDLVTSHALVMLDLPAGAYEFALLSENGTPLTTAVPYKLQIVIDQPGLRCPKITAAADHTEGTDGGANDVVAISYAGGTTMTLTTAGTDAPEASGLALLANTSGRISGSLADTGDNGAYKDADTFSFTTGTTTDQLTVRLNWAGAADLDWFLFEGDVPAVASASQSATAEDEMLTLPVKPSTTYWIWAGLYEQSTGPITYDLSLCGTQFDPP